MTTAYRSCLYERKLNHTAEVVEHRRGSFVRHDLFGVFDVLAIKGGRVVGIQAFADSKQNREDHTAVFAERGNFLAEWKRAGCGVEWHHWKKHSNGRWTVEVDQL